MSRKLWMCGEVHIGQENLGYSRRALKNVDRLLNVINTVVLHLPKS